MNQETETPAQRYRKGQIVTIRITGQEHGQLAAVDAAKGGLYTVRRYYPNALAEGGETGAYARAPITLPGWRLAPLERTDARRKGAREALAANRVKAERPAPEDAATTPKRPPARRSRA